MKTKTDPPTTDSLLAELMDDAAQQRRTLEIELKDRGDQEREAQEREVARRREALQQQLAEETRRRNEVLQRKERAETAEREAAAAAVRATQAQAGQAPAAPAEDPPTGLPMYAIVSAVLVLVGIGFAATAWLLPPAQGMEIGKVTAASKLVVEQARSTYFGLLSERLEATTVELAGKVKKAEADDKAEREMQRLREKMARLEAEGLANTRTDRDGRKRRRNRRLKIDDGAFR